MISQKRMQEFWEKCGGRLDRSRHSVPALDGIDFLSMPDGKIIQIRQLSESIDLNSLFKYAVTEVRKRVSEQQFVQTMHDWLSCVLDGEDPATALFLALEKIL